MAYLEQNEEINEALTKLGSLMAEMHGKMKVPMSQEGGLSSEWLVQTIIGLKQQITSLEIKVQLNNCIVDVVAETLDNLGDPEVASILTAAAAEMEVRTTIIREQFEKQKKAARKPKIIQSGPIPGLN